MLSLPTDVIINNILSHLYPCDILLCKEANQELKNIIERNEEYIDTICQHHIQPHGEFKVWYENGQLSFEDYYKDGKLDGESKSWYENGQLRYQQFYKDGKVYGEHKNWYENGQLFYHRIIKKGN